MNRLVAVLAILRTAEQCEIATNEGIAASVNMFKAEYGPVITTNVDRFMALPDRVLDLDVPDDYVLKIMGAD